MCIITTYSNTTYNVSIIEELSEHLTSTIYISPVPQFIHDGKIHRAVYTNWFLFNWISPIKPLIFINKKNVVIDNDTSDDNTSITIDNTPTTNSDIFYEKNRVICSLCVDNRVYGYETETYLRRKLVVAVSSQDRLIKKCMAK